MDDFKTSLQDLRTLMADFVAERKWEKYHTPKNLAASVSIEAAELLELYQWLTPEEAVTRSLHDAAFRQAAEDEFADVLLYLLSFANALDVDITNAVRKKMVKNRRKYPANEYRGHYERPLPES